MSADLRRGSAAVDVIIGAAMIVFVILPLFSAVVERFILINKAQIVRDALDMTNISSYNSINTGELGKATVGFETGSALRIFRTILAANLNLDEELNPLPRSIAEDTVIIESIAVYTGGFPKTCPDGTQLTRPSVHSSVSVPVRPSLYRRLLLELIGKDFINMRVHTDTEIPLDN
jgi:hypothetical protein